MTTRLSTNGRLIIPKEIRDHLGWRAGLGLAVEEQFGRVILRPLEDDIPETTLEDLIGCVPYDGPPKTLEEMEAAIAIGARLSR